MAFELKITSIEELTAFVRILKGEDIDAEEIKKLTSNLTKSTEMLEKAVEKETHAESSVG